MYLIKQTLGLPLLKTLSGVISRKQSDARMFEESEN